MKINLKNGKTALEETIRAFQSALGSQLSDSVKDFLRTNDGAKPEANIFRISGKNDSGISRFIRVSEMLKERARIENLPKKAYPIAWAEGGNYVFVDEGRNGAVYFWDHEVPENTIVLAPNLCEFLELLEPFDVKSVQLKPGQVKKAWIDPEFLKHIKK